MKRISDGIRGVCGILIWTILFGPHSGFAEPEPVRLDAVVVTAEKTPAGFRTGDVDMEYIPAFTTVIHREAFEGKTESLAEVIEKEAAVQVRQSGAMGSFSTISLRGSSSDQVLVFLDGVLLNDASGGGVDLSNIALSDVAAVEIYRGTSPVQFGRSSIGGVVNIRTRRVGADFGASATAGYGSFDTRRLAGFINHKPGARDYLISADYLGAENDYEILNDNGTPYNPADDRSEDRQNARFNRVNLLGKAGIDLSGARRVDLVNQFFYKEQGLPAWNNSKAADAELENRRNIATLQFIADDLTRFHLNTRTRVSHTWKEEEYDDRGGHIGLETQHNRYTTTRLGGDFFVEWLTDRHALGAMVDVYQETYEDEDLLGRTHTTESERNAFTIGLQNTLFLLDQRLTLSPAIRYTHLDDELESAVSVYGGTPLPGRSRSEDYFSPQIGAAYQAVEWLGFKSNLARYVREPAFFELFGDRGFLIGNPDLEAETGVNFDIGFEIDVRRPDRPIQGVSVRAAYFYSDIDELITQVYDARGIGRSVNISEARIHGFESSLGIDFLDHFTFTANATWQDPENRSDIAAFDGKNLPGRFETAWLAKLEGRYAGVKGYLEYREESDLFYDTANLLAAEDKEEINAGVSWLYRQVLLTLTAKNLGDDRYEDFKGYPLPGRSYFVTLKYEW
ncbi:MAG: TonB-dependent receptor [Thermodesulfobacteriota bacterium]